MQAIFARRQFEHGDCLSQRTLRARHTWQLRPFDAALGGSESSGGFAVFSEADAEVSVGMMDADDGVRCKTYLPRMLEEVAQ